MPPPDALVVHAGVAIYELRFHVGSASIPSARIGYCDQGDADEPLHERQHSPAHGLE